MDSEGVSLPLIHKHPLLPWNDTRKGDCCGRFEAISSDGYICKSCDFFVHKTCSYLAPNSIRHPLHLFHTLQLRYSRGNNCHVCGKKDIQGIFYCCDECDFSTDLFCVKYPPPEVIDTSETHHHKLTLLKERIKEFDCDAKCGKAAVDVFAYKCHECDVAFHVDCVLHRSDSDGVLLPLIHYHPMLPWNDLRKGDCCGRFEALSDGYICKSCDFFVHKKCSYHVPEYIEHPLHFYSHKLHLQSKPDSIHCDLCRKRIVDLFYRCYECDFIIDLFCAKYPPLKVIDTPEIHHHELTLLKERLYKFECAAKCGRRGKEELAYKCHECDLAFHVDCVWHRSEANKDPLEVNHSHHSLHPFTLFTGRIPDYSAMSVNFDGKCRLCASMIDDRLFYHCYPCNFTLDMRCVVNPPQQSLMNLKAHDHQLTFLQRHDSFTCNACGLKGDQSRYICVQCGFMIGQDCLDLPRLININRHDHRVSRTSVLGILNSVCGVCRQKVDWTYGGYSCVRCPSYVVHSKCATRRDVWNGKELEGEPEEAEDVTPYVVIDDNTIKHVSHIEHYLRLHVNGVMDEGRKRCRICTHAISLHSFYSCIDCDFNIHNYCAELSTKKWHVLHNERLTLATSERYVFHCQACDRASNGFCYKDGDTTFDVLCGSILEQFVHPSHPDHPLYYILSEEEKVCNGCQKSGSRILSCIEIGCDFFVCFGCATLPQVVKHRVDDHPLSLCYGEKAIGIYWCDICERKMNPEKWFYTCKDYQASLHVRCVLGDYLGLMPGCTISYGYIKVELNNSISRPFCGACKSHCMYPIMLNLRGEYICSQRCLMKLVNWEKTNERRFLLNKVKINR